MFVRADLTVWAGGNGRTRPHCLTALCLHPGPLNSSEASVAKHCSICQAEGVGPLAQLGPSGPVICQCFAIAPLELNSTAVSSGLARNYHLLEAERDKSKTVHTGIIQRQTACNLQSSHNNCSVWLVLRFPSFLPLHHLFLILCVLLPRTPGTSPPW